ncbi:DUF317 domain-containing protein [Streptomyces ossamyceticus]|nr:DUF317 domain-containing protein [Streptomyces ossamyceticus]
MRFLSQDAVDEVLVSPPCLADGGDPRWITVALHQASGWRYDHAPLSPVVHLVRPDQQAELSLYPDPDKPWWTILHALTTEHPAWYARFGARAPVEILAAFTDALTDPTPATEPSDPFEILYAAGWVEHSDVSASSPTDQSESSASAKGEAVGSSPPPSPATRTPCSGTPTSTPTRRSTSSPRSPGPSPMPRRCAATCSGFRLKPDPTFTRPPRRRT